MMSSFSNETCKQVMWYIMDMLFGYASEVIFT